MTESLNELLSNLEQNTPCETEFHQAVKNFVEAVWEYYLQRPQFQRAKILESGISRGPARCRGCRAAPAAVRPRG